MQETPSTFDDARCLFDDSSQLFDDGEFSVTEARGGVVWIRSRMSTAFALVSTPQITCFVSPTSRSEADSVSEG